MVTEEASRLYLVSSNASREYILDILEVIGLPRGFVQHFRYASHWIQDSLWSRLPDRGGELAADLKGQTIVVAYLYQEEREPGQWRRIAYYPIREATLRDAYKDGGTGHFYFEVRGYFGYEGRPPGAGALHDELAELVTHNGTLDGKYAFLTAALGSSPGSADQDAKNFQSIVDAVPMEHFRTVRAHSEPVQYAPVFVMIHPICEVRRPDPWYILQRLLSVLWRIVRKRKLPDFGRYRGLWGTRLEGVSPQFDAVYRDAYCGLREGREYTFPLSTYHPQASPIPALGVSLHLDYPDDHFVAAANRELTISSRYDHETWRLLPLSTSRTRWSLASLTRSGPEETAAEPATRVLTALYRFPIRIAAKWLGRRFWIVLDIIGDVTLVVGTVAVALSGTDEKGPWVPMIISGYVGFALFKFFPKLIRGE